jgi:hypothetical protein
VENRFNHDGVLKDLLQVDRPIFLDRITGGIPVTQFLNVELPKVLERRLDLVMQLADRSILHVELQASNDRDIAFREGVYCFLVGQLHRGCRIRQTVLYVGRPKMRMPAGVDLGDTTGKFNLMDIREMDAGDLLTRGKPADYVLAMLAGGGDGRIREIVRKIAGLGGPLRERALAQLMVLSGLRGLPARVQWEMKDMGVVIDIRKNPVLMRWQKEFLAEGIQKGREEGREEGRALILTDQLRAKFGPVPKWASERIKRASSQELSQWARKVLTAGSLEGVLGKKPSSRAAAR